MISINSRVLLPCFCRSLLLLALVFCFSGLGQLPLKAAEVKKLNFLFLLADDLGYMDVGFNNPNTFYETQHLDRLARSGMVFTDFYAACQVCSPTRASIMTGKYPARTDTTNFFCGKRTEKFLPATYQCQMAKEEVTLAEALQEHGYKTFFAGKWHLGPDEGFSPTDQGFDINKGGGHNGHPKSYFSPYKNVNHLPPGSEGEFLPDRLAKEAVKFLQSSAESKQPFLLYLSFYSVHTPLMAPEALVEKYKSKAERMGLTETTGRWGSERQVFLNQKEDTRKIRVRQDHATYAAMVESLDTAVGKVLDQLDALGMRDNTVVIFMSDNGGLASSEGWPTSNRPLRGGKGWMYEGGIREPVVVRWPKVTSPQSRCEVPLISMDFYPTMLEMAGLPLKKEQHVDGKSFVSLLKDPLSRFDRDPLFWHYPHYGNQGGFPASAIRVGDYKLIEDLEDGELELYHLRDDISEHNNLLQLYPERVEKMHRLLIEWRKMVEAKPLRPNPKAGDLKPGRGSRSVKEL
ncbi:MAG: sulfatase [Verrucomicrobiales bacterium]|nr:sulfatase [Verrucomicrobiales bacterium]